MADQYDVDRALVEFENCVKKRLAAKDKVSINGCQYALEMARAEIQLLGVDPSTITPLDCDAAKQRLKETDGV